MAHGRPSYNFDGDQLRSRRERGGMTLRDLALRCELAGKPISDSQLSKIERNVCRPRPALLKTLASVLRIEPEDLLSSAV